MLRLWMFCVTEMDIQQHRYFVGVLREASDISVSHQINGDRTLTFKYPKNGEYAAHVSFRPNAIIECEGQLYRITRLSRSQDVQMSVSCEHVFNCDSKRWHIPNAASLESGDFIGEDAYTVLESVDTGSFSLLSNEELEELGMERISVNIDFESMDKTSLYDVMQKIIECAGFGEIYADNYKIAIVNRIGTDTAAVINTALNAEGITVEYDTSELVTRLYPYGKNNLEITNAGANEDGTMYLESKLAGTYGIIDGYRDYSDYTDPDKLMERAMWEFDEENPNRLDLPAVNITATAADLSRMDENAVSLRLGDRVRVIDGGEEFYERVISITRHPFESVPDELSIGRVKKDMFFYLNQLGVLAKRYKSVSTNDGKIQGTKLSGFSIKDSEIYFNGKRILTEEE